MMYEKECVQCGKMFFYRKQNDRINKFCSRRCCGDSKKGKIAWNKGKPNTWSSGGFEKGHIPWNKDKILESQRGEKNHKWKGGRTQDKRGYVFVKCYEHPRAVRGYVAEHVLIAEKKLGRYLENGEEVHHINGNKSDNREENLIVLTKIQHLQQHKRSRNEKGQFAS